MTDYKNELRKIHDRFHGRQRTHTEVGKRSGWSGQELDNVLDEDEQLMYQELEALLSQHSKKRELEARVDEIKRGMRNSYYQAATIHRAKRRLNQLTNGEGKNE